MERPQIAEWGRRLQNVKAKCEYTEERVADIQQRSSFHLGDWERGYQIITLKINLVRNIIQELGLGEILSNNLNNRKWI
jgi:hypothetical protein